MLSPVLFIAFLGGVLPALLWLTFWLLEDRLHPEPKKYIFFCFLGGMCMVPFVLPVERFALAQALSLGYGSTSLLVLFLWATAEELFKFAAAYLVALRAKVFDEPLDAVVYLVTAALGFSAAENVLFLLDPLMDGNVLQTIVTGDLRFIGATLLHTLSSASIGIALAFSFYQPAGSRRLAALFGVILAVSLHTLFNFFILGSGSGATFWIFLVIWLGIIAILLGLERVKRPMPHYP
ncbi:MAG TPA: PrsW family glutamic-type intramembrane protease [Candidatus Paceibacterota bacterium]|nr:PrsW family glutamic-type intramembrane protease [Candidatus Paceibacterota bacterium]